MEAIKRLWMAPFALALLAAPAVAGEGLNVSPDTVAWPRWQARLGVTTAPLARPDLGLGAGTQLQSARLLGDYYFTGPGFGAGRVGGGLRATTGLFTGPRGSAFSIPTLPSRQGSTFSLSNRQQLSAMDGAADAYETAPYLGVGYTGISTRGGWGFTADIGLMAQGSGLRLGRPAPSVDDLLRELRLTPVLQVGVSYSF